MFVQLLRLAELKIGKVGLNFFDKKNLIKSGY